MKTNIKKIALVIVFILLTGCSQKETKYVVVQDGSKDGLLQQSGYIVVKPIYEHIYELDGQQATFEHPHTVNLHWLHNDKSSAYLLVKNTDGKLGIIDEKGKLLLKPIYDSVTYFFDGYLKIEVGGKFGLVDQSFNIVLKPIYDYIQEFVGDIALIHQNGKFGCINKKIELKVKPSYDRIYLQQEQFLRTLLNNKWGYLDNECNVLAKPIYDYAYDFSNGFAKVVLAGNVGYLDPNGKLIAKPIFKKESSHF